jgi:hypothetical protein
MKRRMNAMVIGVLALAGCGDDGSGDPVNVVKQKAVQERMRAEAELERDRAEAIAREKERETAQLKAQVDNLIAEMTKLDEEMTAAQTALAAATSEAERETAMGRIGEVRARQQLVRERLDKVKAGVRLKCPPDQPLC